MPTLLKLVLRIQQKNIIKSINSYKDTLMYYSIDTTPESYGDIHIKLGDSYVYLGELQKTKENKNLPKQAMMKH